MTTASTPWRWPPIRRWPALILLAAGLALGAWQGVTVVLAMRDAGDATPWSRPMVWEMTGAATAALAAYLAFAAVDNTTAARWPRRLAVHLAAYVAYVLFKEPAMLGARFAIYALAGWGPFRYSLWPGHLAMEAMKDAIGYLAISTAYALYRASVERRARAAREAALAAELRETRIQALLGQLDPHFLFNALNTISSVMHDDLARTECLLADLGDLLRAGFEAERATWSLGEEVAHTRRFAALLEARFVGRLSVTWDVAEPALARDVPRFALLILVENAVKHNQDRVAPLAVAITARTGAAGLELLVDDTGRGFAERSPARGAGRGLGHLAEVLHLLHGARSALIREVSPTGGARVRLVVPAAAA